MEYVERIEYKGYKIVIFPDHDCESPREWSNLGTFVGASINNNIFDERLDREALQSYVKLTEENKGIVIPVYAYIHGGITISTHSFYGRVPQGHARFDSGLLGYYVVEYNELRKHFNTNRITKKIRDHAYEIMESEIETYDNYLTGQCYGFSVERPDGTEIDACWGFVGDTKYPIEEAKNSIDFDLTATFMNRD